MVWGDLGVILGGLGQSLGGPGASWGGLGAVLGRLGAVLGDLGTILNQFWSPLGVKIVGFSLVCSMFFEKPIFLKNNRLKAFLDRS